jgi:hypothetical protein
MLFMLVTDIISGPAARGGATTGPDRNRGPAMEDPATPVAPLTLGQQLDARHVLDEQTFDALDNQHQQLAARVADLAATVAMLEELVLR